MKEKYKIVEKKICGINNPRLILKIKTDILDIKIKMLSGSKKIEYELLQLDRDTVLIIADLGKNDRVIEVYDNETKKLILQLKNRLINRLFDKVFSFIKKVCARIRVVFYVLGRGIKFLWREYHFLVPISLWGKYFMDFVHKATGSGARFYNPFYVDDYNKWLKENKRVVEYKKLKYNPKISIVIPVYNATSKVLSECIDSILNQKYSNFEICLADDKSTNKSTIETLKEYEKKDKRIKIVYRKKNGHISKATNSAIEMATGEFIGFMDNDDLLTEDALYQVVKVLNEDKSLDLIYSDEDKLDINGKFRDPHFKPDFSPDTLLSLNYICHFVVVRKKIVDKVGGLDSRFDGSQDYDFLLRVTENTNRIYHIPLVLYHWRMVEGSTALSGDNKEYASDKGKLAIEEALKRRGIKGEVEKDKVSTYYKVRYLYDKEPLISIIIPTRDYVDILKKCIDSIYEKTTYKNFEIIVANNDSKEEETLNFFKEYKKKYKNFKVVDCIMDFNYSKINNIAVNKAKGEYIVLLNNDTEIITEDWLSIMVGYAMQEHIGTVGAKLLYPDYTVQHAGVILGLGGVASHAYIGSPRDDIGMYGRLRVPYDYSANTAACIMIKKSKFLELGGLEEKLQVAYNDVDFNLKILEKGYYNVFLPQVELMHYESKSRGLDTTGEKYKRFQQESKYMMDKWGHILLNDKFYNPNFSKKGCFMLGMKDKN